jgi:hypothetical protein
VVVPPEYWDTSVGVLLFAETGRRLATKGYAWADLSLTGEEGTDTGPLAHRRGKKLTSATGFTKKKCDAIKIYAPENRGVDVCMSNLSVIDYL